MSENVYAEVDWLKGVARAPTTWELRLDSSRFHIYDLESLQAVPVDASDVFALEDVRPDMTIRTILQHATKWMRSSASPFAATLTPSTLATSLAASPTVSTAPIATADCDTT